MASALLRVRQGLPADAGRLAALGIQVWLHTYATAGISSALADYVLREFTQQKFLGILSRQAASVLVAEVKAHLVGYALVSGDTPCPARSSCQTELATLYVQEHFIGKGVGSALLAEAEDYCDTRAAGPLWVAVNAANQRAIAFYARHGYQRIGSSLFELGGTGHENHVLIGPPARQRAAARMHEI